MKDTNLKDEDKSLETSKKETNENEIKDSKSSNKENADEKTEIQNATNFRVIYFLGSKRNT